MAPERLVASADGSADATDLAQAFQELAKGERTATALEKQLNVMEARIEALLAEAERAQRKVADGQEGKLEENDGGEGSAGAQQGANS